MEKTKKLRITVTQGRGLAAGAASNLYAEVMMLDHKGEKLGRAKNTKVARGGGAPKWTETLEFEVQIDSFSGIFVRCWDKHTFRRDGFLGQVTIKINPDILKQKVIDSWFPLSQRGGKKKEEVSGDLSLKIQYKDGVQTPPEVQKKVELVEPAPGEKRHVNKVVLGTSSNNSTTSTTSTSSKNNSNNSKPKEPKEHSSDSSEASSSGDEGKTTSPADNRAALKISANWTNMAVEKNSAFVVVPEEDVGYEEGDDENKDQSPRRKGPSIPFLDKFSVKNSKANLSNKNLEAHVTGATFGSLDYVRANIGVKGGKWYFEVQQVSGGNGIIVGFCTANWEGYPTSTALHTPGDCKGDFWCWDVKKSKILKKSSQPQGYGDYVNMEVIGCWLDVDNKTIGFSKNGKEIGDAYQDVVTTPIGQRLYPFIGIENNVKIRVNFGATAFTYGSEPRKRGYLPLHLVLTENQIRDLSKLFNKYKGIGIDLKTSGQDIGDVIQGNGSISYQTDLGITDDEDPGILIVSWKLNCHDTWQFSRDEWIEGWGLVGVNTIEGMKSKLVEWRRDVSKMEGDNFKTFYGFVFNYLRGEKKVISIDEAILVWDMLLKKHKWALYDKWLEFLRENKDHRAVNRDEWAQLLEFIMSHPKDLNNYDAMVSAWPLVFDNFVEFVKGDGEKGEKDAYNDF